MFHVEVKRLSLMMPPEGPFPKYQPRLVAHQRLKLLVCACFVQESFQSPPRWEDFFEDLDVKRDH